MGSWTERADVSANTTAMKIVYNSVREKNEMEYNTMIGLNILLKLYSIRELAPKQNGSCVK